MDHQNLVAQLAALAGNLRPDPGVSAEHLVAAAVRFIRVTTLAAPEPLLLIPFGAASPDAGRSYTLPRGSVWIRANLIAPEAPANAYAGVTISGGVLKLDAPAALANDQISVIGRLHLSIQPEARVIDGPADGPGADARNSKTTPPAAAEFTLGGFQAPALSSGPAQLNVFGETFDLTPTGGAPQWEPLFRRIVVPYASDPQRLDAASEALAYQLAGGADVVRAAWALSVTQGDPAQFTDADSAGALVLFLGPGLRASWPGLQSGSFEPGSASLSVNENSVILAADVAASAFRQNIRLWFEDRRAPEDGSFLEARFAKPFTLLLSSARRGLELVSAAATLRSHTDRPLAADGSHIEVQVEGVLAFMADATGTRVLAQGSNAADETVSFALSNAVLTTQAPRSLLLNAVYAEDHTAPAGTLTFTFNLRRVLPTLPDPYIANFDVTRLGNQPLQLQAIIQWPEPAAPELQFNVGGRLSDLMPPPLSDAVQNFPNANRFTRGQVAASVGRGGTTHWLLDVSSRADQLGVAFGESLHAVLPAARVDNLALAAPGTNVAIFTLPSVQWEPVEDPNAGRLLSADDGGPTAIAVHSVKLVPIAPAAAAHELLRTYTEDRAEGAAAFSLPFGMRAVADLRRTELAAPIPITPPSMTFNTPAFETYEGGLQIQLQSPNNLSMRGFTQQLFNIPANPQPISVIDYADAGGGFQLASTIFNGQFSQNGARPEVPLSRIDLSGYGESCFSNWVNPDLKPPAVAQVRFDVITGRTSHEVVKVVTYLWPCQAVFVRTITLERKGNAIVVRQDSGWNASTPGEFALPASANSKCKFHKGVVKGYYNIRNVRDTSFFVVGLGSQLQAVYFDADVALENVTRGGRDGLVEVRGHLGFVQLLPLFGPLTPQQLENLYAKHGASIGGPIDCEIDIGGGGQRMRLTGTYSNTAPVPAADPQFAVAAHGGPEFPRSGQWSSVRIQQVGIDAPETIPVDAHVGTPLVRRDGANEPYRFDDPQNLILDQPFKTYGFLFANDASRVLFPRPRVSPNAPAQFQTEAARLADPVAMASGPGLFPKANSIPLTVAPLSFNAPQVLPEIQSNTARDFDLVNTPLWRLYTHTDAGSPFRVRIGANDWKVGSEPQELILDLLGFKGIMRVTGKLETDSAGVRKLTDHRIDFGAILDPVQDLIDILRNLDLGVPLDLKVRTGADSLQLTLSTQFHLARQDGSRIDIGIGKLQGMLRIALTVEASISKGVQGNVMLEISGDYQQSILGPLLYAGGYFRFRVGIDDQARTVLDLTAGCVASIGGDLIPGLIEVEATVKYGYRAIMPRPGAIDKIRPGLLIGMGARAKLLSGLVGLSFDWEGQAVVEKDGDQLVITADIHVAASVTVAWAFHDDVDIDSQFEQRVPFLLAVAVVATVTGVGPVVL